VSALFQNDSVLFELYVPVFGSHIRNIIYCAAVLKRNLCRSRSGNRIFPSFTSGSEIAVRKEVFSDRLFTDIRSIDLFKIDIVNADPVFFCDLDSIDSSHGYTEHCFRIRLTCHLKYDLICIVICSEIHDLLTRIRRPVVIRSAVPLDRKHQFSRYTCLGVERKPVPLSFFKLHVILFQLDLPCRVSGVIDREVCRIVLIQAVHNISNV